MLIATCDEEAGAAWAQSGCARTFRRRCAATGSSTRARGRRSTSEAAASTPCARREGSVPVHAYNGGRAGTPRYPDRRQRAAADGLRAQSSGRAPTRVDSYPAAETCLPPCWGIRWGSGRGSGRDPLDRGPPGRPGADAGRDGRAHDDPGFGEGERDPIPLLGEGRLPGSPGFGEQHVRRRIEELIGAESDTGYACTSTMTSSATFRHSRGRSSKRSIRSDKTTIRAAIAPLSCQALPTVTGSEKRFPSVLRTVFSRNVR